MVVALAVGSLKPLDVFTEATFVATKNTFLTGRHFQLCLWFEVFFK